MSTDKINNALQQFYDPLYIQSGFWMYTTVASSVHDFEVRQLPWDMSLQDKRSFQILFLLVNWNLILPEAVFKDTIGQDSKVSIVAFISLMADVINWTFEILQVCKK